MRLLGFLGNQGQLLMMLRVEEVQQEKVSGQPPRDTHPGTLYIYCTREHRTAFIWHGKRQKYTGLKNAIALIIHTHTRFGASPVNFWDYILLFIPISVFPLTTPCSFSNSSSQGILAFACSGCTGTLTLWCSTVQ